MVSTQEVTRQANQGEGITGLNLFMICAVSASASYTGWTNWTVNSEDCSETCSNKGGTVEATRQCIVNAETFSKKEVCEKYNVITTKIGTCEEYCLMSGQ